MAGFVCLMPAAFIVGLSLGMLGAWLSFRRTERLLLLWLGAGIGLVGQVLSVWALIVLADGKSEQLGMSGVALMALVLGFIGSFVTALAVTWPLGIILGRPTSATTDADYQPGPKPAD